jgi:histidine ammonia-lyase
VAEDEPFVLGDRALTPADVAAVADGRRVALGARAHAAMTRTRGVIERALERGDPVYGVTRGVGALKTVSIDDDEQAAFNRALLVSHNVGHGPLAPPEIVRAAMVVRAAGLALGYAGVRPVVAEALCAALNAGVTPRLHTIGSVGQADLSQMAEIGLALTGQTISTPELHAAGLEPLELGPREAHAILNANAYTVGAACIGLLRARRALEALEVAAALSYEAVLGNVDALHPAIGRARPYPGDERARTRLAALLAGGALATGRTPPRGLQDALCFKGLAQTHGAAHDALSHLDRQLSIELASSGDSPFVLADEDRAISTGGHEIAPVALALDHARLALAGAVTIGSERIQKLLDPRFTDLPTGLRARPDSAEDGLAIVGHGAASLAAEARLLAAPVTLEQPTSSIAAGIEDRVTMAPVAAVRLLSMSALTVRLAAVELLCAAQAVDLRGTVAALGVGTSNAYGLVRRYLPSGDLTVDAGERLDELAAALGSDPLDELVGGPEGEPGARPRARFIATGDHIRESDVLAALATAHGPLTPDECAERARRAAAVVDRSRLDHDGTGEALLLWRSDSSEAWLNLWWAPRDTGYHDHDGSCVGVHVIDGVARNEALMYGRERRVRQYAAGDSFCFPNDGIHRMEHDAGAITIHVYSPPLRSVGHYELIDGMLQRTPGDPDDPSPPSDVLLAAARSSSATEQ